MQRCEERLAPHDPGIPERDPAGPDRFDQHVLHRIEERSDVTTEQGSTAEQCGPEEYERGGDQQTDGEQSGNPCNAV